jgi:hypothetical protein
MQKSTTVLALVVVSLALLSTATAAGKKPAPPRTDAFGKMRAEWQRQHTALYPLIELWERTWHLARDRALTPPTSMTPRRYWRSWDRRGLGQPWRHPCISGSIVDYRPIPYLIPNAECGMKI